MKILFIILAPIFASAAKEQVSVHELARGAVMALAEEKLEDAKMSERCGVPRLATDYKFQCIFEYEGKQSGGAYSVYLDDKLQVVAVVQGRGKRVGKKMQYSFAFREGTGFREIASKREEK